MNFTITPENRKILEADLKKAEPYTDEEFEEIISVLDGDGGDPARLRATWARRILDGTLQKKYENSK